MSNLSYCKFQNTYHDLLDCYHDLKDNDFSDAHLSHEEQVAATNLIDLCATLLDEIKKENG